MRGGKRRDPGRFDYGVKITGSKVKANPVQGIPLNPSHQPLYKTIVVCKTRQDYELFCRASQVSPRNRMMICAAESDYRVRDQFRGIAECDVVFLGSDPRDIYQMTGNTMFYADELRSSGKIHRAYVYKEWSFDHIEPQVAQNGARAW